MQPPNSTVPEFPVSTDDCRMLMCLEQTRSATALAQALGRDLSVVSRQLTAIRGKGPWVEKVAGKWRVSPAGQRLIAWANDALLAQQRLLDARPRLCIVTPAEFSARVLAPGLGSFPGSPAGKDEVELKILVSERGMEPLLLSGEADLGIGCGTPQDPALRFRKVVEEPYVATASPRLATSLGRGRLRRIEDLLGLPHVRHTQISPGRELGLPQADTLRVAATFNHLSGVRAAACAGLGWAILPRYAVREELERGELAEILLPEGHRIPADTFGVWWLRDRPSVEAWAGRLVGWLKKQVL